MRLPSSVETEPTFWMLGDLLIHVMSPAMPPPTSPKYEIPPSCTYLDPHLFGFDAPCGDFLPPSSALFHGTVQQKPHLLLLLLSQPELHACYRDPSPSSAPSQVGGGGPG